MLMAEPLVVATAPGCKLPTSLPACEESQIGTALAVTRKPLHNATVSPIEMENQPAHRAIAKTRAEISSRSPPLKQ
jgi:hypothetical protein